MHNHNLLKKGLAVGIIFLFIGMSVIPTTGTTDVKQSTIQTTSSSNTLYVGGSGPGNYSKIQDAIDDANPGDTVYVYAGIYNKDDVYDTAVADIKKSIKLMGEDKNTTILNGSRKYHVIRVLKSNVQICGFTIQNSGRGTYPGNGIRVWNAGGMNKLVDVQIYDNILQDNDGAMTMYDCKNSTYHNNIYRNNNGCITITDSVDCTISNNLFIENSFALYIWDLKTITIEYNEFRNNDEGLSVDNCNGVTIQSNNFIDNKKHADFVRQGQAIDFFDYYNLKQNWHSNYWDNWKSILPKPILGKIRLWFLYVPIPIFVFEYDLNPASEPYDIGV